MKNHLLFLLFILVSTISRAQLPVAAFTLDDSTICPGTCNSFTNLSTNATSYLWTFAGAVPSTSTVANPQNICYNTPGNYSVTLVAINANGSDTLFINNCISVYPYSGAVGCTILGDTLFANQGFFNYQWYFNGFLIPGDTFTYHVAIPDGVHELSAIDSNGCEVATADFGLVLFPDFVPSDTEFCAGSCIDFYNLSNPDTTQSSHQWHFNGAIPSTSLLNEPQNICYPVAGNFVVKLVMLCSSHSRSDSMIVHVLPCTGIVENKSLEFSACMIQPPQQFHCNSILSIIQKAFFKFSILSVNWLLKNKSI